MAVERTCEACGVCFYVLPFRVRNGEGRFCSKPCAATIVANFMIRRNLERARGRIGEPFLLDTVWCRRIALACGAGTLIEDSDIEIAALHCWSRDPHGYAVSKGKRNGVTSNVRLHREILPPDQGREVDHINGDRLDNRRSNLRLVVRAENMQNITCCRKDSRTGVLGVVPNKKRTAYVARAKVNGKFFINKTFRTIAEAEAALKEARRIHQPFYAEAPLARLDAADSPASLLGRLEGER